MNQQTLYEKSNSQITQTINFQVTKRIVVRELEKFQCLRSFFLSPYSSLLLIEYYREGCMLKVFYKYENGSLICFKTDDEDDQCKQCLFMKHTNEIIILYETQNITCYQIDHKQQLLKKFQNIYVERAVSLATDENEQTLYISNEHIYIYKRQTPIHSWVLQSYILLEQTQGVTLNYACNTITTSFLDFHIFKCFQKIIRLNKFRSFYDVIIAHFQDEYIIAMKVIIQWNKQTRKILRRYKPKIKNKKLFFSTFDQVTQLFICLINDQICICRFQNGKFNVVQILPDEPEALIAKIGNNGKLLIQRWQYDQLIISEQIE